MSCYVEVVEIFSFTVQFLSGTRGEQDAVSGPGFLSGVSRRKSGKLKISKSLWCHEGNGDVQMCSQLTLSVSVSISLSHSRCCPRLGKSFFKKRKVEKSHETWRVPFPNDETRGVQQGVMPASPHACLHRTATFFVGGQPAQRRSFPVRSSVVGVWPAARYRTGLAGLAGYLR